MSKERDYLMDNIKALLLFLVAFGHTLDAYKGTDGIELYMMKYLYYSICQCLLLSLDILRRI